MIEILIPTYNRSKLLKKNILLLDKQISKNKLSNYFRILVSDNRSEDDTWDNLKALESQINCELDLYRQEENIGLEPNAIFLLGKAKQDYVMYLGDDDYLPDGYLDFVVDVIKNESAYCVIPGFSSLYPDGTIKPSRNAPFDIKRFEPGFSSVCEISNFGHQLSGIVTRKKFLYDEYMYNSENRNIYPFIFFVTYCALKGATYYAPKFQVLVSQGNSKDWNYDASGLLLDIFRNYKIAFSDDKEKLGDACISFVKAQPGRLRIGRNPFNSLKALVHLVRSSEVDRRLKIRLLALWPKVYLIEGLRSLKRKLV